MSTITFPAERPFSRVSFQTLDHTTLRGNLYLAAASPAPIVVMTQGYALLKEQYLLNWGGYFLDAGVHVLTYDHRNFGVSDGTPREEVRLDQQAEDYLDAVTFAQGLKEVENNKVFIWGIGHSGGAAGT